MADKDRSDDDASIIKKIDRRKTRSSQNALKHGLSRDFSSDPKYQAEIDRVTNWMCESLNGFENENIKNAIRNIAIAQLDIMLARRIRVGILSNDRLRKRRFDPRPSAIKARLILRRYRMLEKTLGPWEAQMHLDPWESVECVDGAYEAYRSAPGAPLEDGLHYISKHLDAVDRYEKRALSKRKKAIRILTILQSEIVDE